MEDAQGGLLSDWHQLIIPVEHHQEVAGEGEAGHLAHEQKRSATETDLGTAGLHDQPQGPAGDEALGPLPEGGGTEAALADGVPVPYDCLKLLPEAGGHLQEASDSLLQQEVERAGDRRLAAGLLQDDREEDDARPRAGDHLCGRDLLQPVVEPLEGVVTAWHDL